MVRAVRFRFSVMMFLQYAVWGVWAPILAIYLLNLADFKQNQNTKIAYVYMTMAIASMLAPFIAGQIADRYFATQRFLAVSHLVGGVLLLLLARLETFTGIFAVMLAYTLIYAPTVALTNSICFHHLPDGEKDFGRVRLWGTLGWILIGWLFSMWIGLADGLIAAISPAWQESLVAWRGSLAHKPNVGDCLYLAAALSFLLGVYSITLPHTPPPEKPENPWAFLSALRLMKNRSFAVLLVVAFLVATELQFYYVLTPMFFNQGGGPYNAGQIATILAPLGAEPEAVEPFMPAAERLVGSADRNGDGALSRDELAAVRDSSPEAGTVLDREASLRAQRGGLALDNKYVLPVMTIGQICETIVLALLPIFLRAFGFRIVIAFGIAAWAIRYFIFAIGEPVGLVIASQTLHGFGFGFFFVGAFIFGDSIASKDIKASVQSLLVFTTMGAGMFVSSLVAGPIADHFASDWHKVFLVPAILCAACCVLLAVGFRPVKQPAAT